MERVQGRRRQEIVMANGGRGEENGERRERQGHLDVGQMQKSRAG